MSSSKLPLDQLNLSGNASGSVDLLWVGSIRDAETRLKLDIAPPQKFVPGEIPLRGQVDGIYRGSRDELEVSQLRLTTSDSEITAAGNLAATSSLHFSATSHNLKEWNPLFDAVYGSNQLPFTVHGWATFTGNATGKLSALSVAGNLEVYDFDTTLPAIAPAASVAVHWDALATALQYSTDHFAVHNGSLIHGHTTAHFDASAILAGGTFPENTAFTLHFDLRNADLAEATHVAGLATPLVGTLNVTGTLSGTRSNPHGDGHLEIRNGIAYGISVPLLKSDLRLSGGEFQFNNIDASAYDAPLTGSAAISVASVGAIPGSPNGAMPNKVLSNNLWNREFRLNLAGRNLALSRFPRLQNGTLLSMELPISRACQRHHRAASDRSPRSSQGPGASTRNAPEIFRSTPSPMERDSISKPTPDFDKADLTDSRRCWLRA